MAERRDRGDRIVRWIGAAKRRAAKFAGKTAPERGSAEVIPLDWADTFGRPSASPSPSRQAESPPMPGGVVLLRRARP